jgi:AcrR family transcriptional regulator
MKNPRIDIQSVRREQIVEAAVAIITEQGLQNLSLSEIEKRAGMSRGQLTYYFPAKEDILLAVFDRLLQLMYQRIGEPESRAGSPSGGRKWVQHLLDRLLRQPPVSPEFHVLQYTFLSQIGHREDFRQRLATLYEEWRTNLAKGIAADVARSPGENHAPPRALATLVQAILHGLAMQAAADPMAFDREEMANLVKEILNNFIGIEAGHSGNGRKKAKASGLPATALKTLQADGSSPLARKPKRGET